MTNYPFPTIDLKTTPSLLTKEASQVSVIHSLLTTAVHHYNANSVDSLMERLLPDFTPTQERAITEVCM